MAPPAPLGQFLELAIPTRDIAASVEYYERLGFAQRLTGDGWSHPYGVLGDGRIHLGLHQQPVDQHLERARAASYSAAGMLAAPTPCFVYPGLARHAERLLRTQLAPERAQLGEESLHHLWLRDPGGHALLLQEARTFSPAEQRGRQAARARSLCGSFLHLSLAERDFEAALAFWERAGFVGMPEEPDPYAHQPLISDQLALAFHTPRTCDSALLVFEISDTEITREQLRARDIQPLARTPRALQRTGTLLLEAPEGTLLLLVASRPDG
jgi:catechol 2,3-dioxygenase-like lactoylglutathione lyase family enzyme